MFKIITLSTLLFSSFVVSANNEKLKPSVDDNSHFSLGIGVGQNYGGLGVNAALISETDMKYIAFGCSSYSSGGDGADCDTLSIGWIKTDLFNVDNNNHGFGLFLSSEEEYQYQFQSLQQFSRSKERIYEYGVQYSYFMNEMNNAGFNFGVHVYNSDSNYDDNGMNLTLQVGYQF
jgi:hypothetical protein